MVKLLLDHGASCENVDRVSQSPNFNIRPVWVANMWFNTWNGAIHVILPRDSYVLLPRVIRMWYYHVWFICDITTCDSYVILPRVIRMWYYHMWFFQFHTRITCCFYMWFSLNLKKNDFFILEQVHSASSGGKKWRWWYRPSFIWT
jgi:hypothetical protein